MAEKVVNVRDIKSREQFEDYVRKGYRIQFNEPYPVAPQKKSSRKKK